MQLPALLLLPISGAQAAFYGFVYSYIVGNEEGDRFQMFDRRLYSFSTCEEVDSRGCGNLCSVEGVIYNKIEEIGGEWCQKEVIFRNLNGLHTSTSGGWTGGNWTDNRNGITASKFTYLNELRIRGDTGKPNSSPVTTILPVLRVNSNCQRNIVLLAFDPDGDEVRCRYASSALSECSSCATPSVLSLSSSCTLSFSPTNSSSEGPYALQLIMEDFAAQTITMTQLDPRVQGVKTAGSTFNKISTQFIVKVDPAVPSCTEGAYLPRFLPPTPDHRSEINTTVNHRVEITIRAEANHSVITDLLITGPYDGLRNRTGAGQWTLTWTPTDFDEGISQPICFIAQANVSSTVYHSDLRCLIVIVANNTTPQSTAAPTTTTPSAQTPATNRTTTVTTPTTQTPTTTRTITTTEGTTTVTTTTTFLLTNTTAIMTPTSPPRPTYVVALKAKLSTSLSIEKDYDTIVRLLKEELIRRGLPSTITVRILKDGSVQLTAALPSG